MATSITSAINIIGSKQRGSITLSPFIKENLVGVWNCYGKKNEDADRAIIKNKIRNRGGDLLVSNVAYAESSGYGGGRGFYNITITSSGEGRIKDVTPNGFTLIKGATIYGSTNYYYSLIVNNTISYVIKVSGLSPSDQITIQQYNREGAVQIPLINGINKYSLPLIDSGYPYGSMTSTKPMSNDVVIEFLEFYPNSLVTDGVNDFIESEKTVVDILEGSEEITVVSMIHQIELSTLNTYTNVIRTDPGSWYLGNIINKTTGTNKTGIYGYTGIKSGNVRELVNVAGDKNDYTVASGQTDENLDAHFTVEGWKGKDSNIRELSQVAYYWTFIAKSVLTTDEINQIIAYYDLDRTLTPMIYYDIKRQGLSNDTPNADWYLKDFSGNGRDAKLYNYGKSLGSGIGKYLENYMTYSMRLNNVINRFKDRLYVEKIVDNFILWTGHSIDEYKVLIKGLKDGIKLNYYHTVDGIIRTIILPSNGEYLLPASEANNNGMGFSINSFDINKDYSGIEIIQIPEHPNALVSDGVDDYAQYVGDLGLKDYTVVADRAYVELVNLQVPIVSSIIIGVNTPFIFEYMVSSETDTIPFSFGASTVFKKTLDINKKTIYQSSYIYNKNNIIKGSNLDTGSGLTIGRYGNTPPYSKICLYSLLLYPYSLSEFLIERQLKKLKLSPLNPEPKNK